MVTLNPETHIYTDEEGIEYKSVTRFINQFVPTFDFEKQSSLYASKYGMCVEEVRDKWTQQNRASTDFGTKIHSLIENAIKDDVFLPGDCFTIVHDIVEKVKKSFKGIFHTEQILSDKEFLIAGTSDLVIEEENTFSIVDFKTNKQIKFVNEYDKKTLLYPLEHLPSGEYFKYSLQLSFYAYFYSKSSGKNVDRLTFYWLKRKNSKDYDNLDKAIWMRFNCPYLKEEVESCLATLKN